MYKVVYNEISRNDLLDIILFYKNIDIKVLNNFKLELLKIESSLSSQPAMYRTRYDDVRRINFINFPFCIFYEIKNKEVRILKVIHQSRDPIFWP